MSKERNPAYSFSVVQLTGLHINTNTFKNSNHSVSYSFDQPAIKLLNILLGYEI
jgi:hypothetical protein